MFQCAAQGRQQVADESQVGHAQQQMDLSGSAVAASGPSLPRAAAGLGPGRLGNMISASAEPD